MIDIDATEIKMLPGSHITLQDYDGIMHLQKSNKTLKNVIFIIASVGLLILTLNILSNGKANRPKISQTKGS
jgi:hypothetical protein